MPSRFRVIYWLMDLRREPRPPEAAPVPGFVDDVWIADIPGTGVSFLYLVSEDAHSLTAMLLESPE